MDDMVVGCAFTNTDFTFHAHHDFILAFLIQNFVEFDTVGIKIHI
jgi:hypothetical protein